MPPPCHFTVAVSRSRGRTGSRTGARHAQNGPVEGSGEPDHSKFRNFEDVETSTRVFAPSATNPLIG
eukprot:6302434-Alexandrium_andersonii.AAC.1